VFGVEFEEEERVSEVALIDHPQLPINK